MEVFQKLKLLIKRYPLQTIIIFVSVIVLASIPYFINLSKEIKAKNLLKNAEQRMLNIENEQKNSNSLLKNHKEYYKEYDKYETKLSGAIEQGNSINKELRKDKKKLKHKNIRYILNDFDVNNKDSLIVQIKNYEKKVRPIDNDIQSVYKLTNQLITNTKNTLAFKNSGQSMLDDKNKFVQIILNKGKNGRVKKNIQNKYSQIENNERDFLKKYDSVTKIEKKQIGQFSLSQLRDLLKNQNDLLKLLNKNKTLVSNFDNYYQELKNQYYTVVTRDYHRVSIDHVIEPNPAYHEWKETKTYQTTETRYKTESYKENNVTKTKKVPYTVNVTKKKTITKNNGKPKTIAVPYEVYKYYYTIEKTTPNGETSDDIYVGKKHAKYDSFIHSWSYDDEQEEGYTVWKQKWNDNQGIVKGFDLYPKLEN